MTRKRLLCTGLGGTAFAAACCFTPLLVVALGALGLSAWLGWADLVLFPAMGLFIALTIYALRRPRAGPEVPAESAPAAAPGGAEGSRDGAMP